MRVECTFGITNWNLAKIAHNVPLYYNIFVECRFGMSNLNILNGFHRILWISLIPWDSTDSLVRLGKN